jgi:hypothetical protein
MIVADLCAEAVLVPVPAAGIVDGDPGGRCQAGAQHLSVANPFCASFSTRSSQRFEIVRPKL